MRAESITIKDDGWKWLLAGILGLALIFAGYGLSSAMGMGGGMGMGMGGPGGSGGSMMGYRPVPDRHSGGTPGTFYGNSGQPGQEAGPITREDAANIVQERIGDNPNLKVGKITERKDGFEVNVVTGDGGGLADRLFVQKDTGRVRRIY